MVKKPLCPYLCIYLWWHSLRISKPFALNPCMFLRNITLQKSCVILGQVLCTYQGKIKSCCSFDFCNLSMNQLMRPSKNFVLPYIYPVYFRRICVFTACDVHIYISQSVLPSWSHGLSHVPYIRSILQTYPTLQLKLNIQSGEKPFGNVLHHLLKTLISSFHVEVCGKNLIITQWLLWFLTVTYRVVCGTSD